MYVMTNSIINKEQKKLFIRKKLRELAS